MLGVRAGLETKGWCVRVSPASLRVSLSKKINPCLVLVQHRKTRPDIAEIADLDVNHQIK